MSPFHYIFDKFYPLIRYYHEKVSGNDWFTEITPQLWLGGAPTYERDYKVLLENNIGAVVNIRAERADNLALYKDHGIEHLRLSVYDMSIPDREHFSEGVRFIRKHVEQGDRVLIHCAKGRGRSAVLLAAYLMRYHDMTFDEAVAFMKEKRQLVKQEQKHKRAAENWLKSALQKVEEKVADVEEDMVTHDKEVEEGVERVAHEESDGARGFG